MEGLDRCRVWTDCNKREIELSVERRIADSDRGANSGTTSDPSTTLFEGGATVAGIFRCPRDHPSYRDSGPIRSFVIAFPRASGWLRHEGGRSMVITPAMATIYNRGQRYTRAPIAPTGDRSDWIAITDPALVRELVSKVDRAAAESPDSPLRFPFALTPAPLYSRQRLLFSDLRAGLVEPLRAEEEILTLFQAVLHAMQTTWAIRPAARTPDRSEDRDRVQAVLALLAARFRDPLRLEDLARFAGISIVHLCRLFRRHTGSSIHQTLNELRLRAALEAIGDPGADLTRVALDLGFSSHSHFSETFRRTFGRPPSQLRRCL